MAVSPAKAILDTSVYLPFLRRDGAIHDLGFLLRPTLLYMSSVVFAELYAGAKDRPTVRLLERLYRTFDRLDRMIAPDKQVWFEAAQVLRQLGLRRGFEATGLARLTHDVLIALAARKLGAVVLTRNRRDFERIRELRHFDLQVYEESERRT
ncbi:MAG: type II toxin-antitoxin system VapC family toxin [Deltaproteobacteria bacterium]|nr:type II toxin-antitoxin system VapC family toxin [Deltaproteobacteria bacterium]